MIRSLRLPVSSIISTRYAFLESGAHGSVDVPVRYALLEHSRLGPILVDTGYTRHLASLRGIAAAAYRAVLSPRIRPDLEPVPYLRSLGIAPRDVQHVIVTHLHADHVSGLLDFREATIHLSSASARNWRLPFRGELSHGLFRGLLPDPVDLRLDEIDGNSPIEAPHVRGAVCHDVLSDGTLLALPLPGHMDGHIGLVFRLGGRTILYAADVAWTRLGYRQGRLPPFPLRAVVQAPEEASRSSAIVAAFEADGGEVILCHDPEPTEWDIR